MCFQSNTDTVTVTSPDLCREDYWGPWVSHGGALGLGNGHRQPPLLQEKLCKIWILQETSGECVIVFFFLFFYVWYDPVHLHYCNHWWVYFIIVGFFPRSHGFHILWNEWDRGSFPAHTGTRCVSLWCSFVTRLTTRRLLFDEKDHLSPLLVDVPRVQQLSRDPRSPPCQRTEQEVLEEVLLHSTEVRALFLQQRNFQG